MVKKHIELSEEYQNPKSLIELWCVHTFVLMVLPPDEVGDCVLEDLMTNLPNDEGR